MLSRKTPLRRTPMKRGVKAKPKDERLHHARVAVMPCIACQAWPVEVHHVRHDGLKSISRNHRLVVPLCPSFHRTGPNAVHVIGHLAFDELHGIRQHERAMRLWEQRRV